MAESPAQKPEPHEEVDLEAALEKLTAEQLQKFEFIINEDGSVTFVDFPAELMDLAYALNPDDPLVCERRAQAAPTADAVSAEAPTEPAE
jgi:c-di-GMP-related signal transduction protein